MDEELWGVVVDAFDLDEKLRRTVRLFGPYDQVTVVDELEKILAWMASRAFGRDFPRCSDPGAEPFQLQGLGAGPVLSAVPDGPFRPTLVDVDPPVTELWQSIRDHGTAVPGGYMLPKPKGRMS